MSLGKKESLSLIACIIENRMQPFGHGGNEDEECVWQYKCVTEKISEDVHPHYSCSPHLTHIYFSMLSLFDIRSYRAYERK